MWKSDEDGKRGIVRGRHRAEKVAVARRMRREMTPAEALLWERLRANGVGGLHFRRQQVIDGFVVDFYCHGASLVVELDGAVHDGTTEYDDERTRCLEQRGLTVLRLPN